MTEIRPIRTEADYEAALAQIRKLWGAKSGTPEGDRLDVLATLVEAYEDANSKMAAPDPITAIEFRMEQQGLGRKDLEPFIGSRARVSEVMSRKRGLSIAMIRRLSDGLGIPLESLVQPMAIAPGTAEKSRKLASTAAARAGRRGTTGAFDSPQPTKPRVGRKRARF